MFLCENCLANSSISFDQKQDRVQLGYVAVSEVKVMLQPGEPEAPWRRMMCHLLEYHVDYECVQGPQAPSVHENPDK